MMSAPGNRSGRPRARGSR
uniref:Uncharacterized protein n=1 Tax=Arundo donax TaxID=35708 RepID=A0A0A8YX53_ARUDO